MPPSAFSESNEMEQRLSPPSPAARPLWPWFLILTALAILLLWRLSRPAPSTNDGPNHPGVGSAVTEFSLAPLTGDPPPVELASLDGKLTLINFWGPWCGPCDLEFPHLLELAEHFRPHPEFQFLSVSYNPDPFDTSGLAQSTSEFLRQKK